ncbi:unnamed protein product [Prunus armeniaca]|uniref:Uncharacterized protein n=1 Tax=Prunus armeniaca TaxID=36596 RepID=A0A6J5WFW3_PRUAR|nr:unnamed protein product [Prunus armeniaca]
MLNREWSSWGTEMPRRIKLRLDGEAHVLETEKRVSPDKGGSILLCSTLDCLKLNLSKKLTMNPLKK